jgi:DNA repair protein SbcD/Mre11
VLLSGDVADRDNKFWEAIGPLERGIGRLVEAGIRTIAVSGNHDYDVLGRLADQFPPDQFTLLGRGGRWERTTVGDGQALLCLDGWSFPAERVYQSPLEGYDLGRDPSVPTLGIVHGDLDVSTSSYAPLDLTRLRALPPDGWLLGHIHAPRLLEGHPWALYPGSPQALDPGETGPHGPWIVEIDRGLVGTPRQVPLSTVWYGRPTIDVSRTQSQADVEATLLDGIRTEAARTAQIAGPHLALVSLRLRLEGDTPVAHQVEAIAADLIRDLSLAAGSASVAVESVDIQTMPIVNLAEYAATHTAPGAVARLLLELDRDDPAEEVAQLIRQARAELERVDRQREFAQLDRRKLTEEMVRAHLRAQGRQLLTQLVHQTT